MKTKFGRISAWAAVSESKSKERDFMDLGGHPIKPKSIER
jgi:hypothetical protein